MAYQPKSYRKFVATAATATLVASAVTPAFAAETGKAAVFTDVAPQYKTAVDYLLENQITNGLTDTQFGTNFSIKRVDAAIMIAKALKLDLSNQPASGFTDVPSRGVVYVDALKAKGIVNGKSATSFDSDKEITRGEIAIMFANAFGLTGTATHTFTDVAPQYDKAVQALVAAGITSGKTPASFGTNDSITRGEFAIFTYRAASADDTVTVKSASAINATTLSVTFSNGETAEITLEQALAEGLNKVTFQHKGQTFTDVEVTYTAPSDVTLNIKSAEARSNTQVQVELGEAPLKELKASDFNISPALNITSISTSNNVVTLETAPQQNGTEYTITPAKGSGSAKFTGLADVSAAGIIDKVEVLNNRQIQVELKTAVNPATVTPDNVYLGLTKNNEAYSLQARSIADLAAAGGGGTWVVRSTTTANADGTQSPSTSFIVESTTGHTLDALGVASADLKKDTKLTYNENATVEIRNAKDASGAYTNTSQGGFTWVDTKAPTIKTDAIVEAATGAGAAAPVLNINFSEPVNNRTDNPDYKIYINGVEVNYATYTDVVKNGTVAQQSAAQLSLAGLEKNVEHEIKIVGAEDLQGNVQAVNPYTSKFIIQDKAATQPVLPAKAAVTDVKQTADNVFEIHFDQDGVVPRAAGDVITLQKAAFNGTEWVDITLSYDGTNWVLPAGASITTADSVTTDKTTKWVVTLDADYDKENTVEATTAQKLNYDSQKVVARDIVVKNFIRSDAKTLSTDYQNYLEGTEYKEFFSFTHDTLAPVASNTSYDVDAGKLYVSFNDAPFNGIIQEVLGKTIKVSKTNKNGVTEDFEFQTSANNNLQVGTTAVTVNGVNFASESYVVIDLAAANATDLLDAGKLVRGDVYTVSFSEGSIEDANRPGEETVDPDAQFGNAATAVSISIPTVENVTGEGAVPQTTPYRIVSGQDLIGNAGLATDLTDALAATAVGSEAYMEAAANKDKILVVFEGEVLEASALNKQNYSFNGSALTAGSTVTFYQEDIIATSAGKESFVIIDLENGSVDKDGLYTVSVKDITNKYSKRMLPVSDSVALTDNTSAVAQTVKVIGSKQVEVKFNEEVTAAAGAENNFTVNVNGIPYGVATVTQPVDKTKLVLTLTQDFTFAGAKAVVTVKKDVNGKMFIKDNAGNEAAVVGPLSN